MSVGFRGLLGAMWVTARALSLIGVLLVVARWSAITRTPPEGDATPHLSFLMFAVLPLLAFVAIGLAHDLWTLSRQRLTGRQHSVHVVVAITGALLLGSVVVRVLNLAW